MTGHCGPQAFRVLAAAGVTVYHIKAATVKEAFGLLGRSELKAAENADVEGHWI